jgi:hypothetical protein
MPIKNGVPGQTRDAATAEAVWGSPRLTKVQRKKGSAQKTVCNPAKMKRTKNDTMNIRQPKKPRCFSLSQSAGLSKNELRQAGMRAPQISRDARHRVVN